MKTSSLTTKQPPGVLWKALRIDGWGLFKSAIKIAQGFASGQAEGAISELLTAMSSMRFKEEDRVLAWELIYRAMSMAIANVMHDASTHITHVIATRLAEQATTYDGKLAATDVAIDQSFFDCPHWSSYVQKVSRECRAWLTISGVEQGIADELTENLPKAFVKYLDNQWFAAPERYTKLLPENRRTPFTAALAGFSGGDDYASWLNIEANRRVFDEDFGLVAVYVPLRAYVDVPKTDGKTVRTVGLIEEMLDHWIEKGRSNDAVRVVEGDPGAGKSSLARVYAATRYGRTFGSRRWRVVYVPLHDEAFTAGTQIEEAVANYFRKIGIRDLKPLDVEAQYPSLLILDGLDELSRGGHVGLDVIRAFMSQVTALLKAWNIRDEAKLLVLMCGRPVAVGEIKAEIRTDGAVVNLLPFLIADDTVHGWSDFTGQLTHPADLRGDQREDWYGRYAEARQRTDGAELYGKIKARKDLDPITAQPLLNYLVAFLARDAEDGALPDNLCGIYETLLKKIWERGWDRGQVPAVGSLGFEQFCNHLETIAMAAWHSGNTRLVRIAEVEDRLTPDQKDDLRNFEKDAREGVLRLLFAFFVRPGNRDRGEQTYEFAHKTFPEYLIARRLVREIATLAQSWKERANKGRRWDDERELIGWVELFGPTPLEDDLRQFIKMKLQTEAARLKKLPNHQEANPTTWQAVLAHLLNSSVRDGMPMHAMAGRLQYRPTFQEMNRQALNAEVALLHLLSVCASVTEKKIKIPALDRKLEDWLGGRWFSSMATFDYVFLDLGQINLAGRLLASINLSEANLSRANLSGANVSRADLSWADLSESDLSGAYMHAADLSEANLSGADVTEANLSGTDLSGANLSRANLSGADLSGADLSRANLSQADLSRANLSQADLSRANLSEATHVTYEQLLTTIGNPAFMPDGKPPKVNWRTAKPSKPRKARPKDTATDTVAPPPT